MTQTKKVLLVIGVCALAGFGYYALSPLWRNEVVNEALPEMPPATTPDSAVDTTLRVAGETDEEASIVSLKQGSFTGFDRIHTGSGTAKIIRIGEKHYIRFEEDFMVNNGPSLYVGFGKDGTYIKGSEISALKGNIGSQNYEIPDTIPVDSIDEIWIWCKPFSVPFARAELL